MSYVNHATPRAIHFLFSYLLHIPVSDLLAPKTHIDDKPFCLSSLALVVVSLLV